MQLAKPDPISSVQFGGRAFFIFFALVGAVILTDGAAATEQTKATYRLIEGKGYTVCEAYLRNLRAFRPDERDPVCAPRPHPTNKDFVEPEWKAMDIWENVEMIYKAEMRYGIYYKHPERHPPYEKWREDFETKVRSQEIQPILKRATIEFVKGKPFTVIAYARNNKGCEAEFSRHGASDNTGFHWFSYDQNTETLKPVDGFAGTAFAGTILLFKRRPYIINTEPLGSTIYLFHTPEFAFAPVRRCTYDVDDPAKPASLRKQRPFTK